MSAHDSVLEPKSKDTAIGGESWWLSLSGSTHSLESLFKRMLVQLWQQVFDHVMFSAIVFQIIMFGLMTLKGGLVRSLLTLPLPFLFAMLWATSKDIISKPLRVLSQRAATDMDQVDQKVSNLSSLGHQPPEQPLLVLAKLGIHKEIHVTSQQECSLCKSKTCRQRKMRSYWSST